MPENLQTSIEQGSITAPAHRCDVIMLVKQFIGSEQLSQKPLLALTSGRSQRVGLVPAEKSPLLIDNVLFLWLFTLHTRNSVGFQYVS